MVAVFGFEERKTTKITGKLISIKANNMIITHMNALGEKSA